MRLTQFEAYAITLAVEGAAALLLAPRFGANSWRAAVAAVIGSAISHPMFWPSALLAYPVLKGSAVPLLEAVVVGAEAIAYRLLATARWRVALALSFLVNLSSWLTGEILYRLP